jgi:membrane protease subunit (stomatin/prohibitin family)
MGKDNIFFLEFLEWFDETGKEIVHRIPEHGSGEVKWGAQLVVREYQAAVFFYKGKAYDAIGPGRHTLKTANIPVLNKIMAIPWALNNPLRTEVYFVNMKLFPDLRWGTRDPIAFKDSELGLVRLRAFGVFNMRVIQPVLFVNTIVGAQGVYNTRDIEEYLGHVIVSRFNDILGEKIKTIFDIPKIYDEMSEELIERMNNDFSHMGLSLTHLYINSITPPKEVQQAIDDRSKMSALDDLNEFIKLKAAAALENISKQMNGQSAGGTGSALGSNMGETMGAGMGLGMGFMMPAMFADLFKGSATPDFMKKALQCPDCKNPITADARFCPSCGHHLMVIQQCSECGKNLPPSAKFCPSCGTSAGQKPQARKCPHCGADNLKDSKVCSQCGEKL